jgi:hypothetical protein
MRRMLLTGWMIFAAVVGIVMIETPQSAEAGHRRCGGCHGVHRHHARCHGGRRHRCHGRCNGNADCCGTAHQGCGGYGSGGQGGHAYLESQPMDRGLAPVPAPRTGDLRGAPRDINADVDVDVNREGTRVEVDANQPPITR